MTVIHNTFEKTLAWDRDRVSVALLLGLLGSRLGSGVALLPAFEWPFFRLAVFIFYHFSTFLLTALLIYRQRDRLAEFRIGRLAVIIFIASAPFQLGLAFSGLIGLSRIYPLLNLPVAIWLAVMLSRRSARLPASPPNFLRWLAVGCLVGTAAGFLSGWLISYQHEQRAILYTSIQLALLPAIQLTGAATQEEPLFRGFLWGWLEKNGWRPVWIWLAQAGLFWLGHIYYLGVSPYSFFLVVPLMGLLFGWLSWRSRDIAPGMLAHGLTNGIAQIVSGN